jgi:hypothetical protein
MDTICIIMLKMVKNVENVRKFVFKMILFFEEKKLLDIMYTYNKSAQI